MYKGKYERNQAPASPKEAKNAAPRPASQRKGKKPPTKGTYIFYGIYFALILACFIGIAIAMGALKDWLVSYEASQPKVKSQQVFDELFSDPDWAEIYALAEGEDGSFDGKDAYAAYMEELVGDDELTFLETSAGLSGDKKYIVRHGEETIATFTLTAEDQDADIPDWQLGAVEVFYSRNLSYNIIIQTGSTVSVNGTVLDDSYIIRTVSTKAENYLPEGIHGYRLTELRITGLMAKPEVVVTDENGQAAEITYDEQTCTFTQVTADASTISDEEYDIVLTAAKAYSEYMLGAAGASTLKKHFDASAPIYTTITTGDKFLQSYASYTFGTETITDYYRYSDDLFSAKIQMTIQVTRKAGTIKEFEVDSTLLFEKSGSGWLVTEMTNVDIQEQITTVRLTYKDSDGNVLASDFVDADTNLLTPPTVTAPEGKVFAGWYAETVDDEGNTTLTLAFQPGENGEVTLGAGQTLEPMTLVPHFETAQEDG